MISINMDKENIESKESKMIIGVTGGIGAGKSTVLQYIQDNYPVTILYADEIGHELMAPGKILYQKLVEHYGTVILEKKVEILPNQVNSNDLIPINRSTLAQIALKTPESIQEINEIEHPIIKEEIHRRIQESPTRIVFVEAALLEEGGLIPMCDEVLIVDASEEVRIKRLMAGRGYSLETCKAFMARQKRPEEFLKLATVVIENNENFEITKRQIQEFMLNK